MNEITLKMKKGITGLLDMLVQRIGKKGCLKLLETNPCLIVIKHIIDLDVFINPKELAFLSELSLMIKECPEQKLYFEIMFGSESDKEIAALFVVVWNDLVSRLKFDFLKERNVRVLKLIETWKPLIKTQIESTTTYIKNFISKRKKENMTLGASLLFGCVVIASVTWSFGPFDA